MIFYNQVVKIQATYCDTRYEERTAAQLNSPLSKCPNILWKGHKSLEAQESASGGGSGMDTATRLFQRCFPRMIFQSSWWVPLLPDCGNMCVDEIALILDSSLHLSVETVAVL